jgi:hypothetical protein
MDYLRLRIEVVGKEVCRSFEEYSKEITGVLVSP